MKNEAMILIDLLAPMVDKLKVSNPLLYTILLGVMYATWLAANYTVSGNYILSPVLSDLAKAVNLVMPLALGALQSRTTSYIQKDKPVDEDELEDEFEK